MAALFALYSLIVAVLVFLVPGMLVVRLLGRGRFPDSFLCVAFGTGMTLISFLAFLAVGLAGLFFRVHVSWALLAATAALVAGAAALATRWLEGSWSFLRDLAARSRLSPPALLLALYLVAVTGIWLLGYDSVLFDQERCIDRAGFLPFFDYLSARPPVGFDGCVACFSDRNAFLVWNGGQREGPAVFVSTFPALFGFAGFRLLHAACGLLTAWFGFHLGQELFSSRALGYVTSALLALNPYVLSIPLLDENTLALAMGTAMFYAMLGRRPDWLLAGLFLGVFLGIRHEAAICLPAVFFAAWRSGGADYPWWPRALGSQKAARRDAAMPWVPGALLALSTLAFCTPWIIAHTKHLWAGMAMDGFRVKLLYESFYNKPPVEHSLLGIRFDFPGLLSWPFVEAPLRSPYNGFPTLLSFPLTILRSWSAVLLSLAPAGLAWAWRNHRTGGIVGLLWLLPQLAVLCTMGNWVEPNKMGVFLCYSQPIALGIASGLAALAHVRLPARSDQPPRGEAPATSLAGRLRSALRRLGEARGGCLAALTVAALGLLVAFQLWASTFEAPLDERSFSARVEYITADYSITPPMLWDVESAYALKDRERLSALSLLPDVGLVPRLGNAATLRHAFSQLGRDLAEPTFALYCERPKDVIHTLSGLRAPPPRPGDERRGGTPPPPSGMITVADVQQHPVSYKRDAEGGAWGLCAAPPDEHAAQALVRFDLSAAPVSADTFFGIADAAEAERDAAIPLLDKPIVSFDNRCDWADDNPCHWVIMPIRSGEY
jgi:hypothetical protein